MLVLTGNERNLTALEKRLTMAGPWALQEVRADLLERVDESLFQLLARHESLIFAYKQPEPAVFVRALAAGAAYIDMDYRWPAAMLQQFAGPQLLVSAHLFDYAPEKWPRMWQQLLATPGAILKLAVMVEEAADIITLKQLVQNCPRPVVLVAMGAAGQLSRRFYRECGSLWSYLALDGAGQTAPGQICLSDYQPAAGPFFALLGGPQISHSPGPAFYRQYFPYYPVVTRDLPRLLPWLRQWGLAGASVTMPNKVAAYDLCQELTPAARAAGAVNTLYWQEGRLFGDNSDYLAFAAFIRWLPGRRAVILGRGGAATAARAALVAAGWQVGLYGRDRWADLPAAAADLLINATPVGYQQETIPVNIHNFPAVIDLVMSEKTTRLVEAARAAGSFTVDGYQFWQQQAAFQLELFQGILRRR